VVTSRHPAALMVRARKRRHLRDPFAAPPQQSDYVQIWTGSGADAPAASPIGWLSQGFHRLPGRVKWPIWNQWGRLYRNTVRNRTWFRPVKTE
jgi:hypothetical protein